METSTAETPPAEFAPATKSVGRSWLRFRLWHLMLVVLVLAIPLTWVARRLERVRRWRAAAERLEEMGCQVDNWYRPQLGNCFGPPVDDRKECERRTHQDPLWFRGLGPTLFGQEVFFRPARFSNWTDDKRPFDLPVFWETLSRLDSLESLHLTRDPNDVLVWPGAAAALNRLSRLEYLDVAGEVTDDLLNQYVPPPSLTQMTTAGACCGSMESWRVFFARSRIESLEVCRSNDVSRVLVAARELRFLKSLALFDCTLDQAALDALIVLRPTEQCALNSCRGRGDSPRVQERLDRWGSGEVLDFTGDEWRVFTEAGAIDRPREESP